jgi:hypothetical protein
VPLTHSPWTPSRSRSLPLPGSPTPWDFTARLSATEAPFVHALVYLATGFNRDRISPELFHALRASAECEAPLHALLLEVGEGTRRVDNHFEVGLLIFPIKIKLKHCNLMLKLKSTSFKGEPPFPAAVLGRLTRGLLPLGHTRCYLHFLPAAATKKALVHKLGPGHRHSQRAPPAVLGAPADGRSLAWAGRCHPKWSLLYYICYPSIYNLYVHIFLLIFQYRGEYNFFFELIDFFLCFCVISIFLLD